MALFHVCLCGQNLRSEEHQAGGFTRCAACGRLVRVPSLHRANEALGIDSSPAIDTPQQVPFQPVVPSEVPETKAVEVLSEQFPPVKRAVSPYDDDLGYPLSPAYPGESVDERQRRADRRRARRLYAEAEEDLAHRPHRRPGWTLETNWLECLLYPFRALGLILGLAAAWATLIAFLVAILPETWGIAEIVPRLPFASAVFLLLGYTCACLHATLASAMQGDTGYIAWPGTDLALMLCSGARGLYCFVAGPLVPAAVAFWFWLGSGDLQSVDWLIIWELGIVAVTNWTLTLLAVQEQDQYQDANPVAVVQLVRRMGYRVLLAVVLVSTIVVGHGLLMFKALEELHKGLGGWLLLTLAWAGLLFWVLFLLRWLGVMRFHMRKKLTHSTASPPAASSP